MSWWEIALLVYFIPFPFPQIATIAFVMVLRQDYQARKRGGE
jgi:hypothetical protein